MTEKERSRAKFLARVGNQQRTPTREDRKRWAKQGAREKAASREEQHARYLDCGPLAWDDKGETQ